MNIYYPVKNPINKTNLFGANPDQYKPLGQIGHPGLDFECPIGTPIYSPCDGAAFYVTDKNGGCGIYIRTPDTPAPTHNIILWHMVAAGNPNFPYGIPTTKGMVVDVKAGQLLGYSGNTGFPIESTGPHLHVGVMPIGSNELALNPANGYLGCVDPQPFFNGLYAEDIGKIQSVVQAAAVVIPQVINSNISVQEKSDFLAKVAKFFRNLFIKQ